MNTILYHSTNVSYENYILDALKKQGYEVVIANTSKDVINNLQNTSLKAAIISLEDIEVASNIIAIARSHLGSSLPKIVFLSTLLTWAGTTQINIEENVPILCNIDNFLKRLPASGVIETYKIENLCYSVAKTNNRNFRCFGIGTIYGGPGFDLEHVFRSYWQDSKLSLETPKLGLNKVPMIHIDNLVNLLITNINDDKPINSQNFYTAAVDGNTQTVKEIFESIATAYEATVEFLPCKQWLIDDVVDAPDNVIWNYDLCFTNTASSSSSSSSSSNNNDNNNTNNMDVNILWKEFIKCNDLAPVKMMLAGPSIPFKSNAAAALCRHLSLERITVEGAVKWVQNFQPPINEPVVEDKGATEGETETKDPPADGEEPVEEVKVDTRSVLHKLYDALAEEVNTNVPKAKGAPDVVDLKEVEINKEVTSVLSANIIQSCLELQMKSCRKGYLLDVWGDGLGMTMETLKEIVPKEEVLNEPTIDVDADATPDVAVEEEKGETTETEAAADAPAEGEEALVPEEKPKNYTYFLPEVVVEFRTDVTAAGLNWLQTQFPDIETPIDVTKLGKDEAAAYKDIETKLEEYKSTLVTIPVPPVETIEDTNADAVANVATTDTPTEASTETEAVEGEGEPEADATPEHLLTCLPGTLEMEGISIATPVEESATPSPVIDTISKETDIVVVRADVSDEWQGCIPFDVVSFSKAIGVEVCSKRGPIGWTLEEPLEPQPEPQPEPVEEANTEITAEGGASETPVTEENVITETSSAPTPEPVAVTDTNSTPDTSTEKIKENNKLAGLSEKHKKALLTKTAKLEKYILSTVGPHLTECLVKIEREKPEDPLKYLIEFLDNRSDSVEQAAEVKARQRFDILLSQAEALVIDQTGPSE